MHLVRVTDAYDNPDFYCMMGKYFAQPEYTKELLYMKNTPGKVWYLLFADDDQTELIGFSATTTNRFGIVTLCHQFIEPEHRRKGYFDEMTRAIIRYIGNDKTIELTTQVPFLKEYWCKRGFKVYRQTKNFDYFRRDVIED